MGPTTGDGHVVLVPARGFPRWADSRLCVSNRFSRGRSSTSRDWSLRFPSWWRMQSFWKSSWLGSSGLRQP